MIYAIRIRFGQEMYQLEGREYAKASEDGKIIVLVPAQVPGDDIDG